MKMTADQFATAVRGLPLTTGQASVADELLAAAPSKELPRELIRRDVLTEYQAKMILAGRAAELTVGRYAILDELGAGGMGQVFKARDTAMDRLVALKLIRDDKFENQVAIKRFEQEVKAAAKLAHPNIVRAYDAGTTGGRHFLVTELVSGHDLGRELARRGAFPAGEACDYARQTAVGLQHAFEQGLTHRDIKPSNLLFSTTEKLVKVADFGLARLATAGTGGLTTDGTVMGTPDYIAPEQASSANQADIRSDLYSLGCTLYQFLTGHVPFPTDNALAKLAAHLSHQPEPLEEACPGLNPALAAVVHKLMAKNPLGRYQTPLEAADALIPFCPKPKSGATSGPLPRTTSLNAPPPLPTNAPSTQSGAARKTAPVLLPIPPSAEPLPLDDFEPEPEPVTRPRRRAKQPAPGRGNGLLIAAGVGALALVALVLVLVLNRGPAVVVNAENKPQVNVSVPVNVTVKIDDWARAKEPGVVIFLGDKQVSAADLTKPQSLTPGRYTLVAKKDGKEIEARAFDVTPDSANKEVAARPAPLPKIDPKPGPNPVPNPPEQAEPTEKAAEERRWGSSGSVLDINYSPDGKWFMTAECQGVPETLNGFNAPSETWTRRYSGESLQVLNSWPGAMSYRAAILPVHEVALDCVRLETPRHEHHGVRSLDLRNGSSNTDFNTSVGSYYTQRIHLFKAAPDGSRLLWSWAQSKAEGGPFFPSGQVVVYALSVDANRNVTRKEGPAFPGDTACFDPSGKRVLAAKDKQLTLYDENTGKPIGPRYAGPTAEVLSVAMSDDGKRLVAGDKDGVVHVWNAGTKEPAAVAKGHKGKVNAVGITTDGKRVVSAGEDGTVRVWDAANGKELARARHDGPVYSLAMSPGGKCVLTGGADKTIRLWQLP